MKLNPHNGLPVLPNGWLWTIETPNRHTARVIIGIRQGRVSQHGSSALSHGDWTTSVNERWHWLVRFAAKRLYRKAVVDGEVRKRPPVEIKRWEDRYDNIRNFRFDNTNN